MSRAAFSVTVASIYLIILGCVLIFAPNLMLSTFGLPATDEVWIHMLGMVTLFLGISQLLAARAEQRSYLISTVIMRFSVIAFVVGFIFVGLAKPIFILIALVDVLVDHHRNKLENRVCQRDCEQRIQQNGTKTTASNCVER